MANARSRKRRGLSKVTGAVFIGIGNLNKTRNKKRRKSPTLPLFINWGDSITPEITSSHWRRYLKQNLEIAKNRKYSRQHKGNQKPYRMHRIIKNLTPSSY